MQRAGGGTNASRVYIVLDGHGHAVKEAGPDTLRRGLVGRNGGFLCLFSHRCDQAVKIVAMAVYSLQGDLQIVLS